MVRVTREVNDSCTVPLAVLPPQFHWTRVPFVYVFDMGHVGLWEMEGRALSR